MRKITEKQKIFADTYMRLEPDNPDIEARYQASMSAYNCKTRKSALATAKENLNKDTIIEYIASKRPELVKTRRKSNGKLNHSKVLSNPRRVAIEIKNQVAGGRLPNFREAMQKVGYSETTAKAKVAQIKKKRDFKKEMENFDEMLDELILDGVDIMRQKKNKASYKDGLSAVKDLKKTQRLIKGESTSNIDISKILDSLED